MSDISDILPLVDSSTKPSDLSSQIMKPKMDYLVGSIGYIGSDIERLRMNMLASVVNKRKVIRNKVINQIDDMILYCGNKIFEITNGNDNLLNGDKLIRDEALSWRMKILDLKLLRMGENKELFRDILFLRNENIKSMLNYIEEEKLKDIL